MRRRASSRDREHQEQAALFARAALYVNYWPELALLYAIPNGGARSAATGARLKAEGVRPGVPDVHLPVPRGRCPGLWLELKIPPNRPTDKQRGWMSALRRYGHRVEVAADAEKAWQIIRDYLGDPKHDRSIQDHQSLAPR